MVNIHPEDSLGYFSFYTLYTYFHRIIFVFIEIGCCVKLNICGAHVIWSGISVQCNTVFHCLSLSLARSFALCLSLLIFIHFYLHFLFVPKSTHFYCYCNLSMLFFIFHCFILNFCSFAMIFCLLIIFLQVVIELYRLRRTSRCIYIEYMYLYMSCVFGCLWVFCLFVFFFVDNKLTFMFVI